MHGVLTIPDLIETWAREISLNVIGSESRSVTIDLRRGGSDVASSSSVVLSVENVNDAGDKAGWNCRSRRPNLDVDSMILQGLSFG